MSSITPSAASDQPDQPDGYAPISRLGGLATGGTGPPPRMALPTFLRKLRSDWHSPAQETLIARAQSGLDPQ